MAHEFKELAKYLGFAGIFDSLFMSGFVLMGKDWIKDVAKSYPAEDLEHLRNTILFTSGKL